MRAILRQGNSSSRWAEETAKHGSGFDLQVLPIRRTACHLFAISGSGDFAANADYYKKLRDSHPDLLDTNVNTLLQRRPSDEMRMIRTQERHGVPTARAVLSNSYKRLDNAALFAAAMPTLATFPDIIFESADITDDKFYVKVTTPRLQGEVKVGMVVQAGLMMSNSEVGMGLHQFAPFTKCLWCTNGASHMELGKKRRHVGRKITEADDGGLIKFSDEAMAADDHAFQLFVRDTIKSIMTEDVFNVVLGQMRTAAGMELDHKKAKPIVEILAKRNSLTDDVRDLIFGHFLGTGDTSLFGLSSAVTRAAQDVESYDLSSELEVLGGNIINLDRDEYWYLVAA